ncbi:MAG: hypothetical protein QOF59_643, partial [Actinomycetota bacterium]|nr:hypothetical protein [Actinomycetota bacterium]
RTQPQHTFGTETRGRVATPGDELLELGPDRGSLAQELV